MENHCHGYTMATNNSSVTLWTSIWKAYRTIDEVLRKELDSLGLCQSDFSILELLDHEGPLMINLIGKHIVLTSGSITTAVDRLESKSFAKRVRSPKDRRVIEVEITPKGTKFLSEHVGHRNQVIADVTSCLNKKEKGELIVSLEKLQQHALKESLAAA